MKAFLCATALVVGCATNSSTVPAESHARGWRIDESMKFHLAYLGADTTNAGEGGESPPSLGFAETFAPDITNINLAAIRKLGFPLPTREPPERYKLYLKFFAYPKTLDAQRSTGRIVREYRLDAIDGADDVRHFLAGQANLVVKAGFIADESYTFSPTQPFPRPVIAPSPSAQADFDQRVRFSSLYVLPREPIHATSDDQRAAASAGGVLAFHHELTNVYQRALREVSGPANDASRYFEDGAPSSERTVLEIPREPLVFKNWRDLPMPHDAKHIFVSALLLVFRTRYHDARVADADVLEVGSVVRIP